ncbi:MAG: molybdenum cofactor biosynthesis protein [Desulfovibrio sp.]|nr:MAG: molybdenum cofactor biosynthesis protein [Desulfovibrio sp.]
MDIASLISEIKAMDGFSDNVGMVLAHNGVVRSWSRNDRSTVTSVNVTPDYDTMEAIRQDMETRPGIFAIKIHAVAGELVPGDDLLFLVVAGDIRENVIATLTDLLNTVKAKAVFKQEILA